LIYPIFVREYYSRWFSIESTFIADARMLANNLPHPGWQPLWYCGTRYDYIYPPALRYGTALISKIASISTARAYHLYTGILYAFGIAGVHWLVRAGSRSRRSAWAAALVTALFSPSFLLIPIFRIDSGFWVPQRLHVLTSYGEGPHISSLSVLGAALAACFVAFRTRRIVWLGLASLACALVVSNNFYGATALAMLYPLIVWAEWLGSHDRAIWWRAAVIPVWAWGFCAFWLSPSYLWITTVNLHWVSRPGDFASRAVAAGYLILVAVVTWRFTNRRPERSWRAFVFAAAAVMSLYVLGYYYLGLQITGDSNRLVPELDLALILAGIELCRICWSRKWLKPVAFVLAILPVYPAYRYLTHIRTPFPKGRNIENQYEYRVTRWVHEHLPGERVLPSGSVRFWFDAWFNNAQPEGGSLQGMLNQNLQAAMWQIMAAPSPEMALLWLQALGTDAIIVTDKTALDAYHDYPHPEKFRALPVLWEDGHGTWIYRVPRRFPGIARVVELTSFSKLKPLQRGDDQQGLADYVSALETGPYSPATVTWKGFDSYDVHVRTESGQALVLQETFDPYWRAYVDGKRVATRKDPLSFTLIELTPGEHTVQMRFETPLENRIGYIALLLSTGLFTAASLARPSGSPHDSSGRRWWRRLQFVVP
jgi:hypothetical protein